MKTKQSVSHTPGPWEVKKQLMDSEGAVILWPDTSKTGIHKRRLDNSGSFSLHDAALIAAAPELLEAAKLALAVIDPDKGRAMGKLESYFVPVCDALRSAISKAQGDK